MSTNPPRYTEQFKQQLVGAVLDDGKTKAQVAREYGVSIGSVKNWVKQYAAPHEHRAPHHIDELPHRACDTTQSRVGSHDKSRREIELEREVQELKDELAFVRKAAAYIAHGPR